MPGLFLQIAVGGGAGPRFPVAHDARSPRARSHRHLQSFVLRGSTGGPGASRVVAAPAAADRAGHPKDLEGTVRGYRGVRAAHGPERDGVAEVFPARVTEGATPP